MIEDFSIETVEVGGFPIQTFRRRYKSLWDMFSQAAQSYAQNEFLIEGQSRLTFQETEEKIILLAGYLREKGGAGKGDHVGILMENSIIFILTFWAVQKLGATAVVFNNRLATPELARQFQVSDIKILLSSPLLSMKVREIPPASCAVRQIVLSPSWENEVPRRSPKLPPETILEDDVALILFTSGTVGIPKGVMITHRNMITSALKQGANFSQYPDVQGEEKGKTVIVAPLFHVLALQEQLMSSIFMGRTCVLVSSFPPQEIINLFVRERVSILAGTPTMYWMLLHKTPLKEANLDSIRLITYGGAPMPPDLLKELRQTFPGVRCLNGYGLTEASVISILNDEFCELRPTSVGKPALCSEIKIVDPNGTELGPNEVGELAVRGALVSKGYYRLPEETARVYREGWFYTGDLGFCDSEGFLYLVGRAREMINRGGENVYPVEVENILHLHPQILDVAVFGLPDPVMGEIVGCAIILRPGAEEISPGEVQSFCQSQLADYKIPQKIFFVAELPRNPGGKVIKKKLVDEFGSPRK
jgi:long-chain acyl-CoA synthetase